MIAQDSACSPQLLFSPDSRVTARRLTTQGDADYQPGPAFTVQSILKLLEQVEIRAIAHITGGGLTGELALGSCRWTPRRWLICPVKRPAIFPMTTAGRSSRGRDAAQLNEMASSLRRSCCSRKRRWRCCGESGETAYWATSQISPRFRCEHDEVTKELNIIDKDETGEFYPKLFWR